MTSPPKRDYYDVLGVARDADAVAIKAAYRSLAHRYHPDKNPGDQSAEEVFKELSEAYAVLSDPERRARYDRYGRDPLPNGETGFGNVGEIFEGIFGAFRGGARKKRAPGRDVRYTLELSFEEAVLGCEKAIHYDCEIECEACSGSGAAADEGLRPCQTCHGTGQVQVREGQYTVNRACSSCHGRGRIGVAPCKACRGSGRLVREREFVVRIPQGAADGNVKTVRGAGEAGRVGGKPGDLHIILRVRPHPLFVRDGHDLRCEIPISISQAALGTVVEVPTLEGKVRMKVPAGTQSGKIFRLRGKGVPHGALRGDQHVEVLVETPTKLTAQQRELLERLGTSDGAESTPRQREFARAMKELYGE
jgi:molecular chaperone DnaJ